MLHADIYDGNLAKIQQLLPQCQWAAKASMDDCWSREWFYLISETYRTQDRENTLFCQGRNENDLLALAKQGKITWAQQSTLTAIMKANPALRNMPQVTWTLDSNHTKRIAMDCYPLWGTCTPAQLTALFAQYGITHPLGAKDPPHYELDKASQPPVPRPPLTTLLMWVQAAIARMVKTGQRGLRFFALQNEERLLEEKIAKGEQ